MRLLPHFFINLFYCIQIFTQKNPSSAQSSQHSCVHVSHCINIYTHKHTCICIKIFFLHLCISVYNAEWVSSETNKFRHHCHAVLSGTGQRSCNSKKKKKNILPKHNQFSAPLWMICMSGERYNDHSDGNTLETGHSVQERGILGQNLHIIYISPQKKKKNLSSATQKKSNFYNLITSNKHIYNISENKCCKRRQIHQIDFFFFFGWYQFAAF